MPKVPFATLFPDANPDAVDLLENLLQFDPELRFSAERVLEHPYLSAYRDPAEEPVHPSSFDFSFESIESIDGIRTLIAQEVLQYRAQHHHLNKTASLRVQPYR
jgi:mitogen-activated protein kinase 7